MAIDLGIDFGTSSTQIYNANEEKIIVDEPTVAVTRGDSREVFAVGTEALDMLGKTADNLSVLNPVKDGGITNFDVAVGLLKKFLDKNLNNVFSKIRAAVSVPSGIGDVEKRAVEEVVISAGAKEVYLIESPLAGAIGAGVDINEPKGYVIVDVGAGTTEVAVVSLGGVVVSKSVRSAGDALDNDIIQLIKKKYNVEIAKSTAEKAKIKLGAAMVGLTTDVVELKGKDMYSGVPKGVAISANEINSAMREDINFILEAVRCVLEETPPELASDLIETGIVLTGGSSNMRGLGKLIKNTTGINVYQAEDPVCCVAKGAGTAMAGKGGFRNMLTQATRRKNY